MVAWQIDMVLEKEPGASIFGSAGTTRRHTHTQAMEVVRVGVALRGD